MKIKSKEGKMLRDAWEMMEIGDEVDYKDFGELAGLGWNEWEQKRVSSYLGNQVRRGAASKRKPPEGRMLYKKIFRYRKPKNLAGKHGGGRLTKRTDATVKPKHDGLDDTASYHDIGRVIIAKLFEYKKTVEEQEKIIFDLEAEVQKGQADINLLQNRLNSIKLGKVSLSAL